MLFFRQDSDECWVRLQHNLGFEADKRLLDKMANFRHTVYVSRDKLDQARVLDLLQVDIFSQKCSAEVVDRRSQKTAF